VSVANAAVAAKAAVMTAVRATATAIAAIVVRATATT
jgi:hypothetical protein